MTLTPSRCRGVLPALASFLALAWLAAGPAGAEKPEDAKPVVEMFALKNARAAEAAAVLKDIFGEKVVPKGEMSLGVDETGNALIVLAPPGLLADVKKVVLMLDVPAGRRDKGGTEVKVFELRNVPLDENFEQVMSLVVGGRGGKFALGPGRKQVVVFGDAQTLEMAEAVLARLDDRPARLEAVEMQVRVVWLVSGPGQEDAPKPPDDLKAVVEELAKVGVKEPRLAAQFFINVSPNMRFQNSGSPKLKEPCQVDIAGEITDRPGRSPSLQISIRATQEGAKRAATLCNLETQIAAPFGHAVVLGVTPNDTLTSVFVVQVLAKAQK